MTDARSGLLATKVSLTMGGSGPPCSVWFLGPPLVHAPNRISVGSAALAQLVVVTNRHTDHTASVAIGLILCCALKVALVSVLSVDLVSAARYGILDPKSQLW